MKKFVEVRNNYDLAHGEFEDEARELVKTSSLVKIYRYIDAPTDWIIAYVFNDEDTGMKRTFYEKLPYAKYTIKFSKLARVLAGL